MQAAYIIDQSVNILNAPDAWRNKVRPVFADGELVDWILPKGTLVEGDEAVLRVKTGQARPVDAECARASGMTSAQLSANERVYLAASVGINGKKDMELFMAGVIDGYAEGTTDAKPVYIPGENYAAWEDAKAQLTSEGDGE